MRNLLLEINKDKLPKHIAIILDGNGRWAKKRGMPRIYGHKKGIDTLGKIVKATKELGIKNLTVFAFSTENINRPEKEVNFLMEQFILFYKEKYKKLIDNQINVKIIGEYDNLSSKIINIIKDINNHPLNVDNFTFTICFNYGSKQEIVNSIKEITTLVKTGKIKVNDINEELVNKHLYTKDLKPLDLIIRTSGEYRLSNFLLWQAAYAEFYFTDVHFPDFNEEELYKAIIDYQSRNRRFGKIGEEDETKSNYCNNSL